MRLSSVMLADLGLDRNPHAERGLVALAVIACLLGLISVTSFWLRSSASASADVDAEGRGLPFMKQTLNRSAQFLSGAAALFLLAKVTSPESSFPDGWSLITPPDEASVLALQEDVLWVGAREGLFAFDSRTGESVETLLRSRDLRGTGALLVEGEVLWIGSRRGLWRWADGEVSEIRPPDERDMGPVTALCRSREGALWIGAQAGAWEWRVDEWQWWGAENGLKLPVVDQIYEDQEGAIWFASREPEAPGLWKLNDEKWSLYDASSGLLHSSINDIREDRRGVLWLACGFGSFGAVQWFEDGKLSGPLDIPGLNGSKIRSLFEDDSERFWFCSEFQGVAIRDGDAWTRLTRKEGLPGNEVKMMLREPLGTLWLATERGLGRIADN